MNIRYPIYEGVYRILTLKFTRRNNHSSAPLPVTAFNRFIDSFRMHHHSITGGSEIQNIKFSRPPVLPRLSKNMDDRKAYIKTSHQLLFHGIY